MIHRGVKVLTFQYWCRLSDEARAALTHQELKAEFGELVAWRDKIFQKHFPS